MATQIQLRRGTSTEWTDANPVLAEGELGIETDTYLYKIGDGETNWNDLSYRELAEALATAIFEDSGETVAAPPPGNLALYARSTATRMLPRFRGPAGLDSALQPAFFGNGIYMASPGTSTAMNVMGGPALSNVGTMSHPALVSSSLRQQTSRAQVLSANTADSVAASRVAFARVWRGDSTGFGGFFFRVRFSIVSNVATQRAFIGLHSSTSALATTLDPANLTQCFGIGNSATDNNLHLIHNDGTAGAVKTDLGTDFPVTGENDIYDLTLFAPPNGSAINWRIERTASPAVAEGSVSTPAKMPGSGQFLAPHVYMNNGGTAAAVQFDLYRLYIETDY